MTCVSTLIHLLFFAHFPEEHLSQHVKPTCMPTRSRASSWSGVCAFGNSIHCEQRILIFCTDNLENEAMSLNLNESTTHVKNSYLEHELMVNSAQRCGCCANLSSHLDASSLQAYRPFYFSVVHDFILGVMEVLTVAEP